MTNSMPNAARHPVVPQETSLLELLRQDGLALSDSAMATPLAGGVSSEIYLVSDSDRAFVVKRALAKLKVAEDWRSNPARNRSEQQYLRYVGSFRPRAVPQILFAHEQHGYFAMEYLGGGFTNWKTALMRGEYDPLRASQAMLLLSEIHAASRGKPQVAREFETTEIFHELRTDPYLLTTARRHPSLASMFEEEAARLESTRECLVHGDFSPKNILLSPERLVLLDCEVAWYGDAAFDVAFLLNHFCLKALYHAPCVDGLRALFDAATQAYFGSAPCAELDRRSARLLLMLLLARVDGKSPVEYLSEEKKQFLREFVSTTLPNFQGGLRELRSLWFAEIEHRFSRT